MIIHSVKKDYNPPINALYYESEIDKKTKKEIGWIRCEIIRYCGKSTQGEKIYLIRIGGQIKSCLNSKLKSK